MWQSWPYKLYPPDRQKTGEGLGTNIFSGKRIFTADLYRLINCRLHRAQLELWAGARELQACCAGLLMPSQRSQAMDSPQQILHRSMEIWKKTVSMDQGLSKPL